MLASLGAYPCPLNKLFARYNQATPSGNQGSSGLCGQSENRENDLAKADLIKVSYPLPGDIIETPLRVKGEARGFWFFEASFPYKLLAANGEVIAQGAIQAEADWMTEDFVPFSAEIDFSYPPAGKIVLVLIKDNPSGLAENTDELKIPLVVKNPIEETEIKVYFSNNSLDPEITCERVFPVIRKINKTEGIARAALNALLEGPTDSEKARGYFTNLNSGVILNGLTIAGGLAKADFSERLGYQVGGACRVTAIRQEINATLKQFPTVSEVIISINGRIEDVLQP